MTAADVSWVKRAMAKNDVRGYLCSLLVHGGFLMASDGHRVHLCRTDEPEGFWGSYRGRLTARSQEAFGFAASAYPAKYIQDVVIRAWNDLEGSEAVSVRYAGKFHSKREPRAKGPKLARVSQITLADGNQVYVNEQYLHDLSVPIDKLRYSPDYKCLVYNELDEKALLMVLQPPVGTDFDWELDLHD